MKNFSITTEHPARRDGYDIPVYGVDNGTFYYLHIPAIVCIVLSFTCAVTAIVLSFLRNGVRSFFRAWNKSERFVVYLALCDGMFNMSHFTDHLHIAVAKDMVKPKELCQFYGFNLVVFINAQILMVNIVAINAFMLIFYGKNLNFGKCDWKLLTWIFGAPFIGAAIALGFDQLGPNGASCHFDGVNGKVATLFLSTLPLLIVFAVNIMLYTLTWVRVHKHGQNIIRTLGKPESSASKRAARSMSLFVFVFFIQWWPDFVFGIWSLSGKDIPQALFHCMVTFANLGGVLNLIVYVIIRRRHRRIIRGKTDERSHGEENNHNKIAPSSVYNADKIILSGTISGIESSKGNSNTELSIIYPTK